MKGVNIKIIRKTKIELTQLYATLGQLEIQLVTLQGQKQAIATEIIKKINLLQELEK